MKELFCLLLFAAVSLSFLYEMFVAADISVARTDFLHVRGITPIMYRPKNIWSRFAKRLTDIAISLAVCLTVLPLLYIVLGVIIKLTSKGPIIFKHLRVGQFGKEFYCFKFRSMYVDAGPQKAVENDIRVTPVGKFIRKTHLDEIPQFFNVLIGDMSLVGPRPLTKERLAKYEDTSLLDMRLLVRPGITGVNQLKGRNAPQETYLKTDAEYICSQSWWQDFKILCQTLTFKDYAY